MHPVLFSIFFPCLAASATPPWESKPIGVLLLADANSSEWTRAVAEVSKTLSSKYPVESAFGAADPHAIQKSLDRLAAQKIKKVVVLPLFLSSGSSVIDQTRYILGLNENPSKAFMEAPHAHRSQKVVQRIQIRLPLVMAPTLDEHPLLTEILLSRAKEKSKDPAKETVILVGYGPADDSENERVLRNMRRIAEEVRGQGGFASADVATLRNDSPAEIKAKSALAMRKLVDNRSRIILVPYLFAQDGTERQIRKGMEGLFYEWTGKTILPDPRIARWAELSVEKTASWPDMRQFKDTQYASPGPSPTKSSRRFRPRSD